jgi:hypothetical protein
MRFLHGAAAITLSVVLSGVGLAQTNVQDGNVQANQDTQKQLKQEHKADKAQAKADKDERKAMKTKQAKKAAKSQDKADRETDKAAAPPQ